MTDNITLPRATVVQALETQAASKEDMKVYRSIVDNYWKGLAAKAEQQAEPVADGDKVICPACCHQFRGIPETVQTLMLHAGFEPPFTTPPQQQSEPVGEVVGRNEYAGLGQVKHSKTIEWCGEPLPIGTKLYTTPPQQQAEPVQEPYESPYNPNAVEYQYHYPDGSWSCSNGEVINGMHPDRARSLYALKDNT